MHVSSYDWGVWGPQLLTHYVGTLGLTDHVAPVDAYYPVHPWQTSLLRDPGLRLSDLVTPRTKAVHLWHKMLGAEEPPVGSPLHEVMTS